MSMNIGFDAKRFFHNKRGLGNYSRDLVRILSAHAPEHAYYLLCESKSELGEELLKRSNVAFSKVEGRPFARQLYQGIWAERLGLDIYHGLSGELPLRWKDGTARKIVTIHDLIFMHYPNWYSFFDRWIHYAKFRLAAKKADRIIAISEQTKADVVQYLKVPPEKVSVVYQGCHAAFKKRFTEQEKQRIREKWHLPDRFVLQVGAVEPRKNALLTVQAIKNIDISLVLVGTPQKDYYRNIEQFVQGNNMGGRVHLLQGVPMEELAVIYQMAALCCYPSVMEGFGIPIIEALFSKVPVVTTAGGCFEEAGGKAALYIEAKQDPVRQISQAIERLLTDRELVAKMMDYAQEQVKKFSDEAVFEALMKVYEEVYAIEKPRPKLHIVKKGKYAIKRNA